MRPTPRLTSASASAADTATKTTKAKSEKPEPKTDKGRVWRAVGNTDASGYVGKLKVRKVEKSGGGLVVYLETPEGGFSGASWDDLDKAAGAAWAAAYGKAGYKHAVGIIFRGGLVSTTTGKDLKNANTGIFQMSGSEAKQIDWSDKDALANIDWSNFRLFAHPALKND